MMKWSGGGGGEQGEGVGVKLPAWTSALALLVARVLFAVHKEASLKGWGGGKTAGHGG